MSPAAVQIGKSTHHIRELMNKANAEIVLTGRGAEIDNVALAEHYLHSAYMSLLLLLEALGLPASRRRVLADYRDAKKALLKMTHYEGELFFECTDRLSIHLDGLETMFGIAHHRAIERDLDEILRNLEYTVSDPGAFGGQPSGESQLHARVEAVLRSVFGSEVLTKPPIAKPIKNFIPDTGIPSIETLIEYKFIGDARDLGRVVDEVLADTRGYTSKAWSRFVFLIYEVARFKSEAQWNRLLAECDSADRTTAVVLRGSGTMSTAAPGVRVRQPIRRR